MPFEDFIALPPVRTNQYTGPTTPRGKATSSQNAITHGCTAKMLLLPEEKREEYEALRAGWLVEYDLSTQAAQSLIEPLILNDWVMRRAQRKFLETESAVWGGEWKREEDPLHRLQLMQRYKTAAERSFYRSYNAMEQYRKSRRVEEKAAVRETGKAAEAEAVKKRSEQVFPGQSSGKKQREIGILDQWVEVRVEDGKTVTELIPSNEQLMEIGKEMAKRPELVYRRLNFVGGVPEEYAWTTGKLERRENGGAGIQRMTVETWFEVMEREKAAGTGHIGPTGVGNLPRPKEHGECACEVCTHNREILEGRKEAD